MLSLATKKALVAEGVKALGVGSASLHTTSSRSADTWEIPERLKHIPTAKDPSFFNMVEYYFHKACMVAEPQLIESMKRVRISDDAKRKKVLYVHMRLEVQRLKIKVNGKLVGSSIAMRAL